MTTVLIPRRGLRAGGPANGRALAYLAHQKLGPLFGTVYDLSTIVILWFAGASAMAALLNLVPRYLPPYGMAPDWARAQRPLVLVFTLVTVVVTVIFSADVNAQGAAYATGVLVLMTSASVAVTIAHWGSRGRYVWLLMTLVFAYTFVLNVARAAGRHQDRVVLHRGHRDHVVVLPRDPLHRAAGRRGAPVREGRGLRGRAGDDRGADHRASSRQADGARNTTRRNARPARTTASTTASP